MTTSRAWIRRAEPLSQLALQPSSRNVDYFAVRDNGGLFDLFDLQPAYQRGSVWMLPQRRSLIRSLIRGVPIGSIVVNDRWSLPLDAPELERRFGSLAYYGVIDGKQRIETIRWFVQGRFTVPADWFRDDLLTPDAVTEDGEVRHSGLSTIGRRWLSNRSVAEIHTAVASTAEEADLFTLINSAGTVQAPDDLARAARLGTRAEDA